MRIERLPDAEAAARWAATFIAERANEAVRARGRFLLALSGGETPLPMYQELARQSLPWERIELFQADERVAPPGSAARNWTQIEQLLIAPAGVPAAHTHPMITDAGDLAAAAAEYGRALESEAGSPPVLDLVHLGLGADGHAASLFAGDPALDVEDAWVAATGAHYGHRRMTLTRPTLDMARGILWLVCGQAKAQVLARLVAGDEAIPAGRLPRDRAWVVTDEAAAGRSR